MSALTTIVVTTTTKVDSAPRDSVLVCRAVHLSNMAAIVHVTTIIIMVKAISLVRVMVSVRSKAVTANVLRAATANVLSKADTANVLRAVTASVHNKAVMVSVHNRAVMVVLNRAVTANVLRAVTVVLSKAVMASVLRAVTVVHNRVAIRRVPVSTPLITIPMQSTA